LIHHGHAVSQKPSRVVILGGTGFIGRNLAKNLEAAGVEVRTVSSAEVNLCEAGSSDILAGLVKKNDTLVMASAVTPDKGRDSRMQIKNFVMGQTLCDFLEKSSPAHVIYLSSDAVYDDALALANEASPSAPSSFYGVAHLGRERMLSDVLKKQGTPLLVLRLSILYGADDPHKSYGPNRFFRTAAAEQKITLFGNGEEKRDHVFVKDACRLITRCAERQSRGLLNVATGISVSFGDIALKVQTLFQGKVRIETTPRANPVTHRHYDIAALLETFPDFRFTPLETGLAETLKEIRQIS